MKGSEAKWANPQMLLLLLWECLPYTREVVLWIGT